MISSLISLLSLNWAQLFRQNWLALQAVKCTQLLNRIRKAVLLKGGNESNIWDDIQFSFGMINFSGALTVKESQAGLCNYGVTVTGVMSRSLKRVDLWFSLR